jgi:hypothetical protein
MKDSVKENIAIVVIAFTMTTTIVLMLIDDFASGKDEYDTEGKTPYELYPDAYENSSFNPTNGYIYNKGIDYENR